MYTLYSIPGSCSTGITVLLEKLGVDYTLMRREDVTNYTSIVPTGQVPALEDEGLVVAEGAAIVLYLLEKHGSDMLPSDLREKATFLQWLMFDYATLHPSYSKILTVKKTMPEGVAKTELLTELAAKTSQTWAILNERLAERKYIVGDTPTIIDYLATIYTSWGSMLPEGIKINHGENVERLVKDISSLPEFKAAYEKENTGFKMAA